MLVALFALLVAFASAQTYDAVVYLNVDCSALSLETIRATPANVHGYVAYAHDAGCVQGCTVPEGATPYYTICDSADPGITPTPQAEGESAAYYTVYEAAGCGGSAVAWGGFVSGRCVSNVAPDSSNVSFTFDCGVITTWNAFGCDAGEGNATVTEFGSTCVATPAEIGDGFATVSCAVPVCFHKETEITYGAEKLTMSQLESHPACSIPHVVRTSGVKISTSCGEQPLRLTDDHLVYTQSGLRTAGSIKLGDFLYNDLKEKVVCEVTKVEIDPAQEYFGLNCEESIVLANGFKTSTFGVTHDLPAIWMKYASKILGVSGASAFGDMVATFLARWKFL